MFFSISSILSVLFWIKKIKLFDGEESDVFFKENNIDLLGELPMTKEIINITHNGVKEISDDLDTILSGIVNKL